MAVIYVGNIDRRSTEASVRSAFEVYGTVSNVQLRPGIAFVEMGDEGQAQKAISDMNNRTSWVLRTTGTAAA
jgi:RNA recognition motif-containing protein